MLCFGIQHPGLLCAKQDCEKWRWPRSSLCFALLAPATQQTSSPLRPPTDTRSIHYECTAPAWLYEDSACCSQGTRAAGLLQSDAAESGTKESRRDDTPLESAHPSSRHNHHSTHTITSLRFLDFSAGVEQKVLHWGRSGYLRNTPIHRETDSPIGIHRLSPPEAPFVCLLLSWRAPSPSSLPSRTHRESNRTTSGARREAWLEKRKHA